jgi:hypothetical protein
MEGLSSTADGASFGRTFAGDSDGISDVGL